jgi:hypothetical protein
MRRSIALLTALFILALPLSANAAIAVDTNAQTSCTGTFTSCTLSYTLTGSNTLLAVGASANSGTPNITGATYNSVAMTAGTKAQAFAYPFYLVGASAGTHNIVVSCSGNCSDRCELSRRHIPALHNLDSLTQRNNARMQSTRHPFPALSQQWQITHGSSRMSLMTTAAL